MDFSLPSHQTMTTKSESGATCGSGACADSEIKLWGVYPTRYKEYFGEQGLKNCFSWEKGGYEPEGFDTARGYQNSADTTKS
ncbi:MAG: hypothetical protein CM15mP71_2310 [Candidatus Poseidoniales archaeon]|nr:MAG: hypothetical protein CM15mP71_2310 [Candidatus Poseidoniales archaeon]